MGSKASLRYRFAGKGVEAEFDERKSLPDHSSTSPNNLSLQCHDRPEQAKSTLPLAGAEPLTQPSIPAR
jgi:hypothetical protein